jgi:hypothetical protein
MPARPTRGDDDQQQHRARGHHRRQQPRVAKDARPYPRGTPAAGRAVSTAASPRTRRRRIAGHRHDNSRTNGKPTPVAEVGVSVPIRDAESRRRPDSPVAQPPICPERPTSRTASQAPCRIGTTSTPTRARPRRCPVTAATVTTRLTGHVGRRSGRVVRTDRRMPGLPPAPRPRLADGSWRLTCPKRWLARPGASGRRERRPAAPGA